MWNESMKPVSPTISILSDVTFTDGSSYVPPAGVPGTNDNPVGRFQLTGSASGAALISVVISFSGTAADISGVNLWESSDAIFSSSTDTKISSTPQTYGSTVTFSGLSSSISTSGTYYFVTVDLASERSEVAVRKGLPPGAYGIDMENLFL